VPVDPLVGAPTGRVFIVEPMENPVPSPIESDAAVLRRRAS
jgi:hypothetical protein